MSSLKSEKFLKAKIRVNGALKSDNKSKLEKVLISVLGSEIGDSLTIIDEYKESDFIKLYFLINAISIKDLHKRFNVYKQVIGHISNEQLFFENYEFYEFLSVLLTKLKRDSKQLKPHEYDNIESTISELRRMFKPLKQANFLKCLGLVLNTLFFLYFKLRQFHQSSFLLPMVSNLDKVIDNSEIHDRVCLLYYLARLKIYSDELDEAAGYLDRAFNSTKRFSLKRKIMRFFIIVKMRLKVFPSAELVQHYKLNDYVDLVSAVRNGNYSLYEQAYLQNRELWIRTGVSFVLGDLESLLILNLIRRINSIEDSNIIKVDAIQGCLNINRRDTFDEIGVMTTVASLISRGFINGRVRYKAKVLQLSKQNPFPLSYEDE